MSAFEPHDLTIDQYWKLLELSADGIWIWDVERDEVSWSPTLCRSLGVPGVEMKKIDILALTHPDDRDRHAQTIDDHIADGGIYSTEVRLRHANGGYVACMARGISERDESGRALRMLGFIVDITKIEEQREALALSEDRFRAFVDNCPAAAYMKSPDGRHLYINEAGARLVGTDLESILGKRTHELFPEETARRLQAVDDQVLSTGELHSWTGIVDRDDGTQRWVHDVKFPVGCADHSIALGGFGFDITELRQSQAAIETAQRFESIGRLAGGVAHDINNVLAVILGYCKTLRSSVEDTSPLAVPLDGIENAARRSANLTRQLLAFARRQPMNPVAIELRGELDRMRAILLPLIGPRVSLQITGGDEVWPVKLDPSQLDQIVTNLCVNARDAVIESGTIQIELANEIWDDARAAAQPDREAGDYVRLSVCDDGVGMDPDVLAKIFEPFYTTKPLGEGTGLGLATVHGIVQQNRGAIEVESEPGRGTKVHVFFQRERQVEKAVATDPQDAVPRGGGRRVLFVDDEVDLLGIFKKNLELYGYRVMTARTPSSALELAQREEFDVLVTDVVMARISGPELAERIGELQPKVRTIYVSGYADGVFVDQGQSEGSLDILEKPFTPDELARRIAACFERDSS